MPDYEQTAQMRDLYDSGVADERSRIVALVAREMEEYRVERRELLMGYPNDSLLPEEAKKSLAGMDTAIGLLVSLERAIRGGE
jgi:hypothetical protein